MGKKVGRRRCGNAIGAQSEPLIDNPTIVRGRTLAGTTLPPTRPAAMHASTTRSKTGEGGRGSQLGGLFKNKRASKEPAVGENIKSWTASETELNDIAAQQAFRDVRATEPVHHHSRFKPYPLALCWPAYCKNAAPRRYPSSLAQYLTSLSVEQMHLGAGGAHDPLILVFGNIWIVINLMLDVEPGLRASENEMGHQCNMTAPRHRAMI